MQKVQIIVRGRTALIDQDMVEKMLEREALIKECSALRDLAQLDPSRKVELFAAQTELAKKISSLNREISQNVQFF